MRTFLHHSIQQKVQVICLPTFLTTQIRGLFIRAYTRVSINFSFVYIIHREIKLFQVIF